MFDIVIIGGGASGLACAVAACEAALRAERSAPKIIILESSDKVGRSILRSGNGRCNFSNADVMPDAYNDPAAVEAVLSCLQAQAAQMPLRAEAPNPVVAFFERLGLIWRRESEGRLYPLANKASVVLDVLRSYLLRFGVEVQCGMRAQKVVLPQAVGGHVTVHAEDGRLVRGRTVVIAAGGAAGAFGLEEVIPHEPPQPTLGPLATDDCFTRPLDNIRVRCVVRLLRNGALCAEERGEVQFRAYGVSGIAIFNLSRLARPRDVLQLDLAPDVPRHSMEMRRLMLREALAKPPSNFELLQGIVLPLVADQILKRCVLEGALEATDESARQIEDALHAFCLPVKGIGDEGLCQVHRGGFALQAFQADSMQAREHPELFVIGEALDVDARCGGFNLHWAFATGMLAGWRAEQAVHAG